MLLKTREKKVENKLYSLDIDCWESDRLPKITAIFASYSIMFIPLFFNHRVVLNGESIPHDLVTSLLKREKEVSK